MGNLLFSNNTLRRLSFSSGFTRALGKKSKGRLKIFFRRPFGFLQLGLPHIKQESESKLSFIRIKALRIKAPDTDKNRQKTDRQIRCLTII